MLITSIVPRLPPIIDGVGDYALRLARQLHQDFGIQTHFIVCDPTWDGPASIDGFYIDKLERRSPDRIVSLMQRCSQTDTFLLHYVGHGYARRGCPIWLVKGLEQWKAETQNVQLVTMFHEIYVMNAPLWKTEFWSVPLQKQLTTQIALLSDRCLTSNQGYADKLYTFSGGKHSQFPIVPVISNIGEPEKILPLSKRHKRLVVFGQTNSKLRVYQESLSQLIQACQILGIEEVWDIGPSTGLNLAALITLPVIEIGPQPERKISDILSNSFAGFFNYDVNHLAKSGIFAAYCSHGLIPISSRGNSSLVDGIESGKHYWVPEASGAILNGDKKLQKIANDAYSWYQGHRLSIQAKVFAAQLADTAFSYQLSAIS